MKRSFNGCQQHRKDICLWVAGALPSNEVTAIQQHLAECEGCRQFHAEIKSTTAPLTSWEKEFLHVAADSRFQARWTQAVHNVNQKQPRHREIGEAAKNWPELVLTLRWHLTGLSAVWVLIIFLSREPSSSTAVPIAQQNKPSTEQLVASLRENRRRIQALTDPSAEVVPGQQPSRPPRRSELTSKTAMV
jgi:anti-sigma factor RsiW